MNSRNVHFAGFLLLAVILLIPSCAVNPVTGKRQLMLVSENQEIAMGQGYDPQVVATFGEYKDEKLYAFMEKLGTEMGLISHRPNLKYHFKILDTPVINAFAVPGGYIYFTRGILAKFNNEAELVGVMGHEMGHITARHTAVQQSRQQLGQLLLMGGMIASEDFRQLAGYAMQGMQLLFLSFSRDNEREADRLGVEYTAKVNYDAYKMADFYQVLQKMTLESHQGGVPTFLSTHPDPGDRYNAVKRDAGEWQQKLGNQDWKVNTDNYLRMIDGMVYGEDPRQGYVEGNVFYHPEMKFRFAFPAGWKLENSPFQVSMAPQDGKALMIFTHAQGKSLDEAAQTTIQQLKLEVSEIRESQ
jgi:predicted Zn-dependent protease